MAIHQFTDKRLKGLVTSVRKNIDRYRAGDFLNYFIRLYIFLNESCHCKATLFKNPACDGLEFCQY